MRYRSSIDIKAYKCNDSLVSTKKSVLINGIGLFQYYKFFKVIVNIKC